MPGQSRGNGGLRYSPVPATLARFATHRSSLATSRSLMFARCGRLLHPGRRSSAAVAVAVVVVPVSAVDGRRRAPRARSAVPASRQPSGRGDAHFTSIVSRAPPRASAATQRRPGSAADGGEPSSSPPGMFSLGGGERDVTATPQGRRRAPRMDF